MYPSQARRSFRHHPWNLVIFNEPIDLGRKDHQQPNHVRSLRDSFRIKKEANFFLQSPTLGKAPTKSLKTAFITEDITPLRSKLLNYVKNH